MDEIHLKLKQFLLGFLEMKHNTLFLLRKKKRFQLIQLLMLLNRLFLYQNKQNAVALTSLRIIFLIAENRCVDKNAWYF